jgi:hypothetical protein
MAHTTILGTIWREMTTELAATRVCVCAGEVEMEACIRQALERQTDIPCIRAWRRQGRRSDQCKEEAT